MDTPWGSSQTIERIANGVFWVSTASHGGLLIRDNIPGILSEKAIAVAHPGPFWNGYVCFEEDCSYAVAFFEHPRWKRFLDNKTLVDYRKQVRPAELCLTSYENSINGYMLERIPELARMVAMSDDQIREEMRAIVTRWTPEYFGLPNRCGACGNELPAAAGYGFVICGPCDAQRKQVRA